MGSKKTCISCDYFHNCLTDGDDIKGYCSIDASVKGICDLWEGPRQTTDACDSWVVRKTQKKTCVNCLRFSSCEEPGMKEYCSTNKNAKGFCDLWDGPRESIEPCTSWEEKPLPVSK